MNEISVKQSLDILVSDAFKKLLSEKHLYQSVKIDIKPVDHIAIAHYEAAKQAGRAFSPIHGAINRTPPLSTFQEDITSFATCAWIFSNVPWVDADDHQFLYSIIRQEYQLPTIKTVCNNCAEKGPFNPVNAYIETSKKFPGEQWIFMAYECQNCKGEPIKFLVRRSKEKLTLSGRDPFEQIETPKSIPKRCSIHFQNALLANHAGQALAAIFQLRVFIEQFWKIIPAVTEAVKGKLKPTGDELGEAYKDTLPKAFKERFPGLSEIYDLLSEAIHLANPDTELFTQCHDKIVKHFNARLVFELSP